MSNKARLDFIKKHKQEVIDATFTTGIFPSVKMAQMIIESADSKGIAGNGITARMAKNFFGIKANNAWKGKKMAFNTPRDAQPVSYFRVYETVLDSIVDHTKFLQVNPRYAAVFKAQTPYLQLVAIQKAGYAENKNYAAVLNQIIVDYKLTSLDDEQEKKKVNTLQ